MWLFRPQPDMDLTANQVTSAGKYIGKFRRWSQKKNTPDGTEGHFDQAALLTRYDIVPYLTVTCQFKIVCMTT